MLATASIQHWPDNAMFAGYLLHKNCFLQSDRYTQCSWKRFDFHFKVAQR